LPDSFAAPEDAVHPVKNSPFHLLLAASLFLVAAAALGAQEPAGEGESTAKSAVSLDFEFFKTKVQPIFLAKRPGHARCVSCHSSNNSALRLQPLSPGSTTWDDEQSRLNFAAVQKVVVPGSLKSPLLIHPLAEAAGGDFFHSGGKHFNSQSDPEWQTLKAFVMGAKAP
jgi:hypothetical protein